VFFFSGSSVREQAMSNNLISQAGDQLYEQVNRVASINYIVPCDSDEGRPLYAALKTFIYLKDGRQVDNDDISRMWSTIDSIKAGSDGQFAYSEADVSAARDFTNFKVSLNQIPVRKHYIPVDDWCKVIDAVESGDPLSAITVFVANGRQRSTAKEYISGIRRYLRDGIFNLSRGGKGIAKPPVQLFEAACERRKYIPRGSLGAKRSAKCQSV
jgi:hypothetical protein